MPGINTSMGTSASMKSLLKTEREMLSAMERISSGKRINSAGDDAAGAAISDRMTATIRALDMSIRNAADVLSMAQVAEGALDEPSQALQRIRELSIQAATDILNSEQRIYLQTEANQLLDEMDRVARDTTFNEIAVLDGSFADRRFQIGTHEREFAQLSISSMRLDSLGAYKAKSQGTETTDIANSAVDNDNLALNAYAVSDTSEANLVQAESFTLHGILGSSSVTAAAGSNVRDIATSVNAVFNATGVSAIASTQLKLEAKSLDDAYNGQTSLSFSIQGKNATATTIAANITLSNNKASSVLSNLRDSINNYTTTTGITATLSTDKSCIIMVQNEGYDIKLGTVNFDGDTTSTGSRRTLMVTSLDNDEVVAGNAVLLGDTSATTTDVDGIYTGTPGGVITIGGRIGTTTPTAFTSSGPLSKATDDDAIVASQTIASGFTGTQSMTMINTATVHNSFITITSDASTTNSSPHTTFKITGTDLNGDALEETIPVFAGAATAQSTNIFATVTSVIPSAVDADANIKVGVLNTIVNQAALVTVTSSASDESGKTFTVTGTGMDGASLTEIITGPTANATVTGRQIFRTIHTVVSSAATTGAITIGAVSYTHLTLPTTPYV